MLIAETCAKPEMLGQSANLPLEASMVNKAFVIGFSILAACCSSKSFADVTAKGMQGNCVLEVRGKSYLNGRCPIYLDSTGYFMVGSDGEHLLSVFAIVDVTGKGVGNATWNEGIVGETHAQAPLGVVKQSGACWTNAEVKICAYK
jgi:hypothetical protein